jgi:hypothetical protein
MAWPAHAEGEQASCGSVGPLPSSKANSVRPRQQQSKASGDPSRIRTCNPRSRNPLLYPVELWDRRPPYNIANMKNPLPRQARGEPFSPIPRQTPQAENRRLRSPANAMLRRGRQLAGLTAAPGIVRQMSHATFSPPCYAATSPSPFPALLLQTRRMPAQGAPS